MDGYTTFFRRAFVLAAMRFRASVPIALAVAAVVVLAGCGGGDTTSFSGSEATQQAAGRDKVKVISPGERAAVPDVSGTTLEGEALSLDDYRGDVVVLNFWASWCAPCRDEVPALQKLRQRAREAGWDP